ncbi:MAG: thioredoxin domain-containing protein [Elusimicrobiota bacterium]|nr:thioredoxin domain-containing protein [Elusimicrobiota bacterium]
MNKLIAAALAVLCALPASAAAPTREELKQALDKNPDLVLQALKKVDKAQFFQLVIEAQNDFRQKQAELEQRQMAEEREAAFKNPLKPALDSKTRFRGDKTAPITLVEYSDFECPFCARGYQTVEALRKKYGAKIRFVFKHLPLTNMHPKAMPAAQWMEAIALQKPEKAWEFHDKMFENQDKLGDEFFRATAKELGIDVAKAEKDLESAAVKDKIEADIKEAKLFKFDGTPGFVVNGVPLRGAYPPEAFEPIISRFLN